MRAGTPVLRTLDAGSAANRAAAIRATPLVEFAAVAAAINDSDPLMAVYAAPEWQELSEDGQQWVCALIRETLARQAERRL